MHQLMGWQGRSINPLHHTREDGGKNKRTWPKKLLEALRAYRNTVRIVVHATPYSLVFRQKTALQLEIQLLSLIVAVHKEITTEEKANLCLAELETLDENRLMAQQNLELYCHQMSKASNKQTCGPCPYDDWQKEK